MGLAQLGCARDDRAHECVECMVCPNQLVREVPEIDPSAACDPIKELLSRVDL